MSVPAEAARRDDCLEFSEIEVVSAGPSAQATRSCRSRTITTDVYNGDVGIVRRIDLEEGELVVAFDRREVSSGSASWMSWCWPTRRRSTKARARNIRRW
jgi:hypothetical protein